MDESRLLGVFGACVLACVTQTSHAVAVSGQGTWETTLLPRDLDGNLTTAEAYYDTDLNITWLANANYADTSMYWDTATAWAAGLNPYASGITGWRLPTTNDVGNNGCSNPNTYQGVDCGYNITSYSEMSHMFYTTLGDKTYYNTSGVPQAGWGLTNTGPFSNVRSYYYWSATEYAPSTYYSAWIFSFYDGGQSYDYKNSIFYAWAVHSGDVGAAIVPLPAAVWLFGGGLLGLIGVTRRRAA